MIISLADIAAWESAYRLSFINSISGYKGVHLIGTLSANQRTNLALFNSVVHIGANPPQLGFIMRPLTVERHTYQNILETGVFTINHVHKSFLEQAHYTSAKLPTDVSEFDACHLGEEFINEFTAPFVKESRIKMGLRLIEDIEIKSNGTHLLVGEIELIQIEDDVVGSDGTLDLEKSQNVCVTGLNQYSSVKKHKHYPYARAEEIPNFKAKERPDNVVFDKASQSYNSSLLPYGTNIGAPSITTNHVSAWKNSSINTFNHAFHNKIDTIKETYQNLINEYQTNEMLYNLELTFEPIIGETYHLYAKENEEDLFLSLIDPLSWNKKHIGSFKLNSEKIWQKVAAKELQHD